MLQQYFQPGLHNQDFASVGLSGDTGIVIIDNSADFSNAVLKWSKLTMRWFWDPEDAGVFQPRILLMAVIKQDEDDTGSFPALDSAEVIRELRNDKKMVRGPWLIGTPDSTDLSSHKFDYFYKPMVLTDFTMDREEDLVIAWTNLSSAFSATSQIIKVFPQGHVRVIT